METKKEQWLWMVNPEEYVHGEEHRVYLSDHGGMEKQGWHLVSRPIVTVTYDLPSPDSVRGEAVDQLRNQIRQVDALAQKTKTELETKIQNLLAIGYTPPATVPADDLPF